jgi:hypothetical protein
MSRFHGIAVDLGEGTRQWDEIVGSVVSALRVVLETSKAFDRATSDVLDLVYELLSLEDKACLEQTKHLAFLGDRDSKLARKRALVIKRADARLATLRQLHIWADNETFLPIDAHRKLVSNLMQQIEMLRLQINNIEGQEEKQPARAMILQVVTSNQNALPTPDQQLSLHPSVMVMLLPLLEEFKKALVFDGCCGNGIIGKVLSDNGFTIVESDLYVGENQRDFLLDSSVPHDIKIMFPPLCMKFSFIKKCYSDGKPFFLLLPTYALSQKNIIDLFVCHGIHVYHITGQPRFYIDNQWKLMGAFCWVAGNLGGQPQITMSYLSNCEPVEFMSGFDFAETEYIVDEAFAEDITTDVSQHDESTDESESMNTMLGQLALERRNRRGGGSTGGGGSTDDGGSVAVAVVANVAADDGVEISPPLPAVIYIHYIHENLFKKIHIQVRDRLIDPDDDFQLVCPCCFKELDDENIYVPEIRSDKREVCGHYVCITCLAKMKVAKIRQCPICRSPVFIKARGRPPIQR